jgi:hypothetical protein
MAAHRRVNALIAQRLHEGDTFGRNARLILSGHPQSFDTPALIGAAEGGVSKERSFTLSLIRADQSFLNKASAYWPNPDGSRKFP